MRYLKRLARWYLGCDCSVKTPMPQIQSVPVVNEFLELFKQCAVAESKVLGTTSPTRVAPHAAIRFGKTSEAVALVRGFLKDTK